MSEKIENQIMKKIEKSKIKSKYFVLTEKIGLGGGLIFSILLSIFFLNLFLFYIKSIDNLEYLSFGKNGILAFLESFPYHWLLIFIIALFIAGYLITKYDISYKKPFIYIAIALILLEPITLPAPPLPKLR